MAEAAVTLLLEQVKETAEGHKNMLMEQMKEAVKEYTDLISGAKNEFEQMQKELYLVKDFRSLSLSLLRIQMAEASVTSLLEQVKEAVEGHKNMLMEQMKEVVKEFTDLISRAENEFEQLQKEFCLVKDFLKKTTKKNDDLLWKRMEKQIREVVYEVEDSITTWLNKAIQAKARSSRHPALSRSNPTSLAEVISSVRREKVMPMFDQVKLRFASMQIADGSQGEEDPRTKSPTKRHAPIKRDREVGFAYEVEEITGYIFKEMKGLDVISIVGMPGLGKTTLAMKIYEDKNINYHFPIRIWVYVSQIFNGRDAFLQILNKLNPSQDIYSLNDDKLIQTVRERLEKEKFLIVLDDVWTVDAWEEIKQVLPLGNGKAKVLVTSRSMDVGRSVSVYRAPHQLRFLTHEESWELFQYEVFGNLEDCPRELEGIGIDITKKCDGLPWKIVVIGAILVDQLVRSRSLSAAAKEWEMVAKDVSDAFHKVEVGPTGNVVALSYDRLPDDLRDCFVYLGVFPEDYEIPVKMLLELWIAEGFILPEDGRGLEEIAEEHLNDLIQKNLLRVEKTNHMGKVKTCGIHDDVRAFCIAKSIEENLFQEFKISRAGTLEPPVSEVQKIHRLCLRSHLSNFLSQRTEGLHARSLLCFDKQFVEKPEYISAISEGLHLLRILEFKSAKLHQFPSKFVKLIHLRYLTLHVDTLRILPEAISEVWNLQSLVVETGSHSVTMKANIWKMIQLRHFRTNAAVLLDSKWEGEAGHNLQTLYRLLPESCTKAIPKKARNLKTLGICGKLASIFKTNFLEELYTLENLKLVNSLTHEATPGDLLLGLPRRWSCFPPNLKSLTLKNTLLNWQHMSTIAMIRNLEVLKLKDNAFVGVVWNVVGYDFPNLQLLLIVNADLLIWEASTDAFPSLRFLVVKNCEGLKEIPVCLGTHLERLEIEHLRHSAVESARKIKETKMGHLKGKYSVQFNLNMGPVSQTK